MFGDLLQLPPVGAPPVFIQMDKKLLDKTNQSMGSYDLWSLFKYDELTINMRQRGDEIYRKILENVRIGDIDILVTRLIPFQSQYVKKSM